MRKVVGSFLIFLSFACNARNEEHYFRHYRVSISVPLYFSLKPKIFEAPSLYSDADCMELLKSEKIGLMCIFQNKNMMNDLGFFSSNEINSQEKNDVKYYVGTPMMMYPMKSWSNLEKEGYYAKIDCDTRENQIYRATATCLSAFAFLSDNKFLFVNLILRDDTKRRQVITKKEMLQILNGFLFN